MNKIFSGMLALSLAFVASEGRAAVLFTADFGAAPYVDGPLIGQNGWVGTPTLSLVNPVAVVGGVVPLTTGQDVNRPFAPQVSTPGLGVSLEATFNVSAATATGDYFLHLGHTGTFSFLSRLYARATPAAEGNGFQLAMGTSSGSGGLTWGSDLAFGVDHSLLATYNFVSGDANDTGVLAVNGAFYQNALTTGADGTQISTVNLRQAGGNAPTLSVRSLTVTAIPEPGSFVALGVIAIGGLVVRRRRMAAKA